MTATTSYLHLLASTEVSKVYVQANGRCTVWTGTEEEAMRAHDCSRPSEMSDDDDDDTSYQHPSIPSWFSLLLAGVTLAVPHRRQAGLHHASSSHWRIALDQSLEGMEPNTFGWRKGD